MRMTIRLLLLTAIAMSTSSYPLSEERGNSVPLPSEVLSIDNNTFIDVNRILMFVTNHGNFGRDLANLFGYDYGTFYPFTDTVSISNGTNISSPLYAAGLWVGGIVNGQVRVTVSEYSSEYCPGPMNNGTFLPDNPAFRVYKLYNDSTQENPNDDYLNWPVDQGAPTDYCGAPLVMGHQSLWSVYNDANPARHNNNSGSTPPLGIEIQQTTFALDIQGDATARAIFLQYKLYNKGTDTIHSCYIGLWADPDLGGYSDDLVGCDTLRNLFYCYNADNSDTQYGTAPPAIGFSFIYGPLVPSPGDSAFFENKYLHGFRNMGLEAFTRMTNGTDPDDASESYCVMQGLDRFCQPISNGTRFMYPGDPSYFNEDIDSSPGDRRMMGSSGPFTFLPGDSQYVLVVMAVGRSSYDRLSSIQWLKFDIDVITRTYQYSLMTGCCADGDINGNGLGYESADLELLKAAVTGCGGTLPVPYQGDLNGSCSVNSTDVSLFQAVVDGQRTPIPSLTCCDPIVMNYNIPGDANSSGSVNITDATFMISYLYRSGPAPVPLWKGDANGNGLINILDVTHLISFLLKNGPEPICNDNL